jgi:hypothetical protein
MFVKRVAVLIWDTPFQFPQKNISREMKFKWRSVTNVNPNVCGWRHRKAKIPAAESLWWNGVIPSVKRKNQKSGESDRKKSALSSIVNAEELKGFRAFVILGCSSYVFLGCLKHKLLTSPIEIFVIKTNARDGRCFGCVKDAHRSKCVIRLKMEDIFFCRGWCFPGSFNGSNRHLYVDLASSRNSVAHY